MSLDLISAAHAAAPAAGTQQGGFSSLILMLGVFFVISYLILWRPQSKRAAAHRKLVDGLSKGDEVITNGGILGKVSKVTEQYIALDLADNVEVKMQKQAVATVLPKGTLKSI